MAKLDTLVQDVYSVLEGGLLNRETAGELFGRYGKEVGDHLHTRLTEERAGDTLRLSNIGKPLRQLYYDMNYDRLGLKKEKLRGETLFKFAYGDVLEALVLVLSEAAGHSITDRQAEVVVDGIKGHIDCVIDGVLVDVKSCSPYSFMKFKTGAILEDDPFGYIGQISGYAAGLGLKEAAFIAINKVSGEITVYHVPEESIIAYDVHQRIETARGVVVGGNEPEKCYQPVPVSKKDQTGNLILSSGCSYCGWKEHCWRDSNNGRGLQLRLYSNGPRWFTQILKEPKLKSQTEFEANTDAV